MRNSCLQAHPGKLKGELEKSYPELIVPDDVEKMALDVMDVVFQSADEDDAKSKTHCRVAMPWRSDLATAILHQLDSMDESGSVRPATTPATTSHVNQAATDPSAQKKEVLLRQRYEWTLNASARAQWQSEKNKVRRISEKTADGRFGAH